MATLSSLFNNFVRGRVDRALGSRSDIALFNQGFPEFRNFISTLKGNALYRNGSMLIDELEDAALYPFIFNREQAYLMAFTATTIHFYTFDSSGTLGVLLDGGSPFTLTNPYTLAQSRSIKLAQTGDTVYITHAGVKPQKLQRTSATTFTIGNYAPTGDPFTAADDYPAAVALHQGRLWLGGTNNNPNKIWASKSGDFTDLTAGTAAGDALEITPSELSSPILWMTPNEGNLVVGSNSVLVNVSGGQDGITPDSVQANKASVDGANDTQPLLDGSSTFYIGSSGRKIYKYRFDLLSESFNAGEANLVSFDITSGGVKRLYKTNNVDSLVYMVRGDGAMVSFINSNEQEEGVTGWHEHTTQGDYIDITSIPSPANEDVLISLVKRPNNKFYIEQHVNPSEFTPIDEFYSGEGKEVEDEEAYNRFLAEDLKRQVFLDCSQTLQQLSTVSITFDGTDTITADSASFTSADVGNFIVYRTSTGRERGRFEITGFTSSTEVTVDVIIDPTSNTYDQWYKTFNTVSGLTDYNGQTVSVVADGGYLGNFDVSGGTIDLQGEFTKIVVGYIYIGTIRSFNLGFNLGDGTTSQTKQKSVHTVFVRANVSAGGSVGTSLYNMSRVQELTPDILNYLPPIPLDGTKEITVSDTPDVDKSIYFVQDRPLPFTLTGLWVEAEHATD